MKQLGLEDISISHKPPPPYIFRKLWLYFLQSSTLSTGSQEASMAHFKNLCGINDFLWPVLYIHLINQFFKEGVYRQVFTVSGLQKHV